MKQDILDLIYYWNNRRWAKKNGCEYYGWYDYLFHCTLSNIKTKIKYTFVKYKGDPDELPF